MTFVEKKAPILLSSKRVKLIIVDSVAALFRCQYSVNDTVQRAKQLGSFASQLHQLSKKFNIPVICVNQVGKSIGCSVASMARYFISCFHVISRYFSEYVLE